MSRFTPGFLASIAVGSATEGFPQILSPVVPERSDCPDPVGTPLPRIPAFHEGLGHTLLMSLAKPDPASRDSFRPLCQCAPFPEPMLLLSYSYCQERLRVVEPIDAL